MATIALYADNMNWMPGLVWDVKQTVTDYKTELSALKKKTLTINKSICNLDDVINSIQASSQILEQKSTSLDTFKRNCENFITDSARTDGNVADVVNQRENDFYDKYEHLKPDCKKSEWEKFNEGLKKAGEWCKEHWITIVTVAVVVLIAAVAVVCGAALACVAAVAGIIALVICAADLICMMVTGGKNIADVLRENGLNVLADIFQGVSIGADIVSIAFPVAAALKTMVKIGVKTFVKASITALKTAFKEGMEKVLKHGFKDGIKNLGKILFKNFILDIDDLKKIKPFDIPGANKHWTAEGDKLLPNSGTIPGLSNPDKLTMKEIMGKHGYDSIPLMKNGNPDMSAISIVDVDISMKNLDVDKFLNGEISAKDFNQVLRANNFENADLQLKALFNNNMANYASKVDYQKALGYKLTWHEDLSLKKCWLVPSEIHNNLAHAGAVAKYKFDLKGISDKISRTLEKISQMGFRLTVDSMAGAVTQ